MPTSNSSNTASRAAQYVEVRTSTYEAAAVAQDTIIEMIEVYPGEKVLDVILDADALGANTSLSVGDGAAVARFITTTTTTSATVTRTNSAADVGRAYKYTAADTIDVKVVGSGAATGTIVVTAFILRTFV